MFSTNRYTSPVHCISFSKYSNDALANLMCANSHTFPGQKYEHWMKPNKRLSEKQTRTKQFSPCVFWE